MRSTKDRTAAARASIRLNISLLAANLEVLLQATARIRAHAITLAQDARLQAVLLAQLRAMTTVMRQATHATMMKIV